MIERMEQSRCYACHKTIYQMPAGRGSPSEWRHNSSAHPISWSPDRHIAGPVEVHEHQHAWGKTDKQSIKHCEVTGCDATVIDIKPQPSTKQLSEREQREQASRMRGAAARGYRPPKPKEVATPSE